MSNDNQPSKNPNQSNSNHSILIVHGINDAVQHLENWTETVEIAIEIEMNHSILVQNDFKSTYDKDTKI